MKTFLRNALHSTQSLLEKMEILLEDKQQGIDCPQDKVPSVPVPVPDTGQQEKVSLPTCNEQNGNPSTTQDRVPMNSFLREWGKVSGIELKELKARLRKHANVARIDYMTVAQVEDACEWIQKNIARAKQGS